MQGDLAMHIMDREDQRRDTALIIFEAQGRKVALGCGRVKTPLRENGFRDAAAFGTLLQVFCREGGHTPALPSKNPLRSCSVSCNRATKSNAPLSRASKGGARGVDGRPQVGHEEDAEV